MNVSDVSHGLKKEGMYHLPKDFDRGAASDQILSLAQTLLEDLYG